MSNSKVPKSRLGPLNIVDADIGTARLTPGSVLNGGTASIGHILRWGGSAWEPYAFPTAATFIDNEVPTGITNGSNVTFTLAGTPAPPESLQLFLGGLLLTQGSASDYVLSGNTITFNTPPQVNEPIRAYYRR